MTPAEPARRISRVLHVVSQYGALSEGFVVDAVASVQSHGWESWLVCRHLLHRDMAPEPPDDRVLQWTLPARRLRQLAPQAHIRLAGGRVDPLVGRADPQILHAHFGWNLPDAVWSARRRNLPLVATFHASDVIVYPTISRRERLLPTWSRYPHRYEPLFPHLSGGIVVSEYIGRIVRGLGFTGPLRTIPAGIRLEQFPFRGPRPAGEGPVRLLFIGRLVPRKGLDVLLDALARPALAGADVHLDVIGSGAEADDLARRSADLGIAERVTFHGGMPRPAVIELLQACDVFVMPSRTMPNGEAEGSPVVTKEAQAVGLPVIATDCGGTRETLPDEDRDRIVQEEDPEALAAAIARTIDGRDRWPEETRRARAFVERHFGWDHLGRETADFYDELVAAGRTTG